LLLAACAPAPRAIATGPSNEVTPAPSGATFSEADAGRPAAPANPSDSGGPGSWFDDAYDALDCPHLGACAGLASLSPPSSDTDPPACLELRVKLKASQPSEPWSEICRVDGSGAIWATRIEQRELDGGSYRGTWELVRLDPGGALAKSRPAPFDGLHFNAHVVNAPIVDLVFHDFDADGRLEAVALNGEAINNGSVEQRVTIWTTRPKEPLTAYRPAAHFIAFAAADVDRDGRPDLAINPYASTSREPNIPIAMYPRHSSLDWGLLAHAQPDGSFSLTSDTAKAVARRKCPAAPKELLPADSAFWAPSLHCARIWGRKPAELTAAIRAACSGPDPAAECSYGRAMLDAIASRPLPFVLE
jgi:hypothetical protein